MAPFHSFVVANLKAEKVEAVTVNLKPRTMERNMIQNITGTFVSEKINKVRWRPDPFNNCHSFLSGSWDNYQENTVKLWDVQETETYADVADVSPSVTASVTVTGDVTELAVSSHL